MKLTKKNKLIQENFDSNDFHPIINAIEKLKTAPKAKFNESVDVAISLGIDPKKSDQNVRGSVVLPNGTGKPVVVAVFADGDKAEEAQKAGADIVGFEELASSIKAGKINFDVLISTVEGMKEIGKLGQILGPKGLMPNPKVGTVTNEIEKAVQNAKAGQVQFRAEKGGIVHCGIGKIDFSSENLQDNLITLIDKIKKLKPASAKGIFIKKINISSTMGPGLNIEIASLSK
jgi:large subunit ribosomal protein L1